MGLSTASEVFLIFTTQLYQYFSVLFLFVLFSDEPEVFLPKYSQTAIPHAAHLRRVGNPNKDICYLHVTWKGKMVVMATGDTLCVMEGSWVLSSRSHTSTVPSCLVT